MPYNAFISYSHAADGKLAPALHSALHQFAKPWYRLRALHIFRDKTTLHPTPRLWGAIQSALDQSAHFILLASPKAATSIWVQREIEHWLKKNPIDRLLIVLTDGTLEWDSASGGFNPVLSNALPESLMRAFVEQPLHLDLRWARSEAELSLRHPPFRDAVGELAAALHGRGKDELAGEDVREHRRTRRLAWSAVTVLSVLTVISVVAALFAFQQRNIAETQRTVAVEQSRVALARQLAAQSSSIRTQFADRLPLAVLLALESTRLHPSFEGNQALRAALTLLPREVQSFPYNDPGDGGRVWAMSFSPDGNYLAVAREEGSADLFHLPEKKLLGTLQPDAEPDLLVDLREQGGSKEAIEHNAMTSLAFSPDGRLLATANNDGTARIWEIPAGREVMRIDHGSSVASVAFAPDGKSLATGTKDGTARVFKVDSRPLSERGTKTNVRDVIKHVVQSQGEAIHQVLFSPDGRYLADITSDGGVRLSNPDTKNVLRTRYAGAAGMALAFSADGRRLASANGDFAFVWDVQTGAELFKATHVNTDAEVANHLLWVTAVAFSSDSKYLATAARDGTARVWNLKTLQEIVRLRHEGPVATVAFAADGLTLSTGSVDGTARLWELPSGRERLRATHPAGSEVVVFSPDGSHVASGGSAGEVYIWTFIRGDQTALMVHPAEVTVVNFNADGSRLVTADGKGGIRLWSSAGELTLSLERAVFAAKSLVFSVTGNVLAGGASSPSLFLVDPAKGRSATMLATSGEARDYVLSPSYIAAESSDSGKVRIWETATGRELPPVEALDLQAIEFDSTGAFLGIKQMDFAGKNGAIRVWDLSRAQEIGRLPANPNRGDAFALSSQGQLLALSVYEPKQKPERERDSFLEVWDVRRAQRVARILLMDSVAGFGFDPSDKVLWTIGNSPAQVELWDWANQKLVTRLAHEEEISRIRFSDELPVLATVSGGRVNVWNFQTGALLSQLTEAGNVRDLKFSPDGHKLLTGGADGTAALWLWRTEDLRTEACKRLGRNLSFFEWQTYLGSVPYQETCPRSAVDK